MPGLLLIPARWLWGAATGSKVGRAVTAALLCAALVFGAIEWRAHVIADRREEAQAVKDAKRDARMVEEIDNATSQGGGPDAARERLRSRSPRQRGANVPGPR